MVNKVERKTFSFLVMGHLGWDKPKRKVSHLLFLLSVCIKVFSLVQKHDFGYMFKVIGDCLSDILLVQYKLYQTVKIKKFNPSPRSAYIYIDEHIK